MPIKATTRASLGGWICISAGLTGYLGWLFFAKEDKRQLLPGITTDGHHQIEQRCDACHDSEPTNGLFTSSGVSNAACLECHAEELELANDSHPVIKFRNPENAIFLSHIEATQCVTCHSEHLEDRTLPMAVTLPPDYCAHCHQVTLENRVSHRDLAFNTCATAGCHNFHDNQALFESFLLDHAAEPAVRENPSRRTRDAVYRWIAQAGERPAATLPNAPAAVLAQHPGHVTDWADTAHAAAGVNCNDCHAGGAMSAWVDRPAAESCAGCHSLEAQDFGKGKHGMRLAAGLGLMEPSLARLPMHPEAAHRSLDCVSCHGAHRFDRQFAAAEACLTCHADDHSLAYRDSAHFALWQDELSGDIPSGNGISCATCHMPVEERIDPHDGEPSLVVQHNQNANLRPNEKMYRGVCLDCHGLAFTMDSLADQEAIRTNFSSPPSVHIESIEWVQEAERKRRSRRREIDGQTAN